MPRDRVIARKRQTSSMELGKATAIVLWVKSPAVASPCRKSLTCCSNCDRESVTVFFPGRMMLGFECSEVSFAPFILKRPSIGMNDEDLTRLITFQLERRHGR